MGGAMMQIDKGRAEQVVCTVGIARFTWQRVDSLLQIIYYGKIHWHIQIVPLLNRCKLQQIIDLILMQEWYM